MLRLKRVELQGFKSFCDRTELRFNGGGIAAVVGPNGCGKSNLSDAISWVLGEQSAKTLRGARMEDVIFAGTRDRKPVGMAAVTMTLVDPPAFSDLHGEAGGTNGHGLNGSQAHQKAGEITITRRLFRSGESEYLMNGRAARLRDIQDLFMGSGLGPESYAIIEQGRIGQILSSKPQDRRAVIEEAAGITKYKTRKRLAEAKLESAKQNLTRVFDILEEVTRQVNSLKRQAAKAKRYTELKAELDARLRLLLSGRYWLLEREAAKTALDLNLAASELRELSEQVVQKEQEHGRLQAVSYETEGQLTEVRRRLAEYKVEAERTRGRLESQVKESGAIEQRIAQRELESQDLDVRLAHLQTELDERRRGMQELADQIASARERMAEKNRTREALQARLREREKSIEAGRLQILRLLGESSTLRNQLAQIEEYLAGIERETSRSQKEAQAATAELERLAGLKKSLSNTMAQQQMELEAVSGERRRTEEDLSAYRSNAAQLRSKIDELRSACSQLKARKDSVEQVLAHRTYTTDTVKRLFGAIERAQTKDFQPLGVLADFVEVDPAYEKSAEEFLHEELEYVVVENWLQADRGMAFLRSDLEGRATFLVHPERDSPVLEALPYPESGTAGRLSDYVRLTNGLSEQALQLLPRLARCFVVADRASAQSLTAEYPDLYFLLQDGICYHGQTLSGGKKSTSGPLALKRESRELGIALKSKQKELEDRTGELELVNREINQLEAQLERLRALQQAREKDTLALNHEMRKLSDETGRANSHLSVAALELDRLRRESERSVDQRERNRLAAEEKEQARALREESLEAETRELENLAADAARIGEEHAAVRVDLAGLEERERGERSAISRLENQWKETTRRRGEIAPEIERLSGQRENLLSNNIELERKAGMLSENITGAEAAAASLAGQEAELRDSLRIGDEQLKQMRARVEEAHQKRSQTEVELVKRQAELKFLDETCRKELNCPIQELGNSEQLAPDPGELIETERVYQEIRARIEGLGPVNPQALEEYQEAQQRQDFLSAQRQDLIESIRDTEKVIQEIDQVSRHKFSEAFEAINQNFREAFQTLFGGGSGEMRLTDDSNLAESGIDIVASPPGKKLQNVLLLSGGEKALAALSLLMAIFRYQPSPFCILDEVDAPLDEANIERLTRLLKEMSRQTQFILITHSKKTMEAAQTMYGVTMQEPGVSKLVAVKFQPVPIGEAIPVNEADRAVPVEAR